MMMTSPTGRMRPTLLAGAMALCSAAAAAQPVSATRVRPRTDSTQHSDSAMGRVSVNPNAIEKLVRELMMSKQMEETLVRSLRMAAAGQLRTDPKTLDALRDSLTEIAK